MLWVIWYRLYKLKNVKNNHGVVLLLVKFEPQTVWNLCICDILQNLTPFAQIKKREKHQRRSVTFA